MGDRKQHIRGYINKQCSFVGFNIADKVSPLKDEITIVGSINYDDFKKGFIRAEVYHYDAIKEHGSELAVKEAGKLKKSSGHNQK